MVDDFAFDGSALPADVHRYMKMWVSLALWHLSLIWLLRQPLYPALRVLCSAHGSSQVVLRGKDYPWHQTQSLVVGSSSDSGPHPSPLCPCSVRRVQLGETVHYLPILFIDQLSNRVKDLMVSIQPGAQQAPWPQPWDSALGLSLAGACASACVV